MGKQTKLASTQQLQGIELLRIFAMNMIIVIHILGKGGLFTAASDSIPLKVVAAFMRASVVPAVNCYVLITGYFLCDKTFKSSRITKNIMITVEYSAVLTCAILILGGYFLERSDNDAPPSSVARHILVCNTVFKLTFTIPSTKPPYKGTNKSTARDCSGNSFCFI